MNDDGYFHRNRFIIKAFQWVCYQLVNNYTKLKKPNSIIEQIGLLKILETHLFFYHLEIDMVHFKTIN